MEQSEEPSPESIASKQNSWNKALESDDESEAEDDTGIDKVLQAFIDSRKKKTLEKIKRVARSSLVAIKSEGQRALNGVGLERLEELGRTFKEKKAEYDSAAARMKILEEEVKVLVQGIYGDEGDRQHEFTSLQQKLLKMHEDVKKQIQNVVATFQTKAEEENEAVLKILQENCIDI